MNCQEEQEEESEVLSSIYDGDECFKVINKTTYQYKFGEDGNFRSFVIEVKWGENYPEEMPTISMDAFYNKHIYQVVKDKVVNALKEECDNLLGCAMTYTLIEHLKENLDDLIADQPDAPPPVEDRSKSEPKEEEERKVKDKKVQLTKSQKRKMYDRLNTEGEMPRGYDWVDIVKHLSQTGHKDQDES